MFTTYPSYPVYRTLRLTDPIQKGEDVYALQTALKACGLETGEADGVLGSLTARAIRQAQVNFGLTVDGLAGGRTQEALAREALRAPAAKYEVPPSAMRGQLEHESSFRLGNYSPQRSNGSYDAGVAQRNTEHTSPPLGFDVGASIEALAKDIRKHFDLFAGLPLRRRWALAQGAWNAPAFACYIARAEGATYVTTGMTLRPSSAQTMTLEAYISDVSVYLSV
jgi:hypothetical protein